MVIGLKWTRPLEIVPYPNIWHEFEAKESRNSEKLVKYRIQDLPEDRFDDAIKHMIDHYLVDEPLSNSVDGIRNVNYVEDYVRMWRTAMEQKMTLVCFKEGSDEIIGFNITYVSSKNDTFFKHIEEASNSKDFLHIIGILDLFYSKFSPYDAYDVDKYMGSLGLSVSREHRGLNLGQRILESRKLLSLPFGIQMTHTFFTSDFSNRNADLAGFKLDLEYTFDELNQINPEFDLKNVGSKRAAIKTWKF